MNIDGRPYRTIWLAADGWSVEIIDQTKLPHALEIVRLATCDEAARRDQLDAGARRAADRRDGGLWRLPRHARGCRRRGIWTRRHRAPRPDSARRRSICAGRWRRCARAVQPLAPGARLAAAYAKAAAICDEDVETCRSIGIARPRPDPRHRRAQAARRSRSTSSPTATPAGSPASTGAPRRRRSIRRTMPASRSMSGSTRRGRAIRAPRSPRSNSAPTACRTPSSSTMPAATSCSTARSTCASSAPIA